MVHVNGRPVPVTSSVPGGRHQGIGARRTRSGARVEVARAGPQRVVAPMPGRIAKVLVKVGDAVAARQGLVVVEAMKMENELRSPRAGIVRQVPAVEGALVEANAVLVVID
ncbi:MAG: acetyl-CoA carboxylase biotin carboxyl carrier protein subunit [Acidobacteria bacterium]|nr:acetyl-CoA carboxylase biotin carboxyl carrier protein subunit [Acidobacteriota bacterium]